MFTTFLKHTFVWEQYPCFFVPFLWKKNLKFSGSFRPNRNLIRDDEGMKIDREEKDNTSRIGLLEISDGNQMVFLCSLHNQSLRDIERGERLYPDKKKFKAKMNIKYSDVKEHNKIGSNNNNNNNNYYYYYIIFV